MGYITVDYHDNTSMALAEDFVVDSQVCSAMGTVVLRLGPITVFITPERLQHLSDVITAALPGCAAIPKPAEPPPVADIPF